jgi:hypothetical protein
MSWSSTGSPTARSAGASRRRSTSFQTSDTATTISAAPVQMSHWLPVTMSGVLGVSTAAYLPYCFFNFASPLDVAYGYLGFKVQTLAGRGAPAVPGGDAAAVEADASRGDQPAPA